MGFDIIDGELWDEETGEYAGPASGWIKGNESPEDLALLVMRKRMDIEASIQAEKDKLDAITNNIAKMLGKHVARLEWLEAQYNAQLQDYAMSQLPRKADGSRAVLPSPCQSCILSLHGNPWGNRTEANRTIGTRPGLTLQAAVSLAR